MQLWDLWDAGWDPGLLAPRASRLLSVAWGWSEREAVDGPAGRAGGGPGVSVTRKRFNFWSTKRLRIPICLSEGLLVVAWVPRHPSIMSGSDSWSLAAFDARDTACT